MAKEVMSMTLGSKKYRIIDLSDELIPAETKVNGLHLQGTAWSNERWIELKEFMGYGFVRMHWVIGQTHCGTHTEAPYKYFDDGKDLGSMPIESYMGEAVVCNFSWKKPREPITAQDFEKCGFRQGDILLAYGPKTPITPENILDWPYLADDAFEWLVEKKPKMFAIDGIRHARRDLGMDVALTNEKKLFAAGIAVTDAVVNMNQITKPRVFFIALPVKLRRATAFWTRAVALEEM